MTTVYIIRHAEAEGNLYRRIHGHYDSYLTKLGEHQIDALEKRFDGVRIDKVYSSDMRRTIRTSTAITRSRSMEAELDPAFREIGMGIWEDCEWGYAERYYREELINFSMDPAAWHLEGAERLYDVQKRMLDGIIRHAAENKGGTIAIFSHGAAIRAMTAALKNIKSEDISDIAYCDNTAVMRLEVSGRKIKIKEDADSSHLGDGYTRFKRQKWHKRKDGLDISNLCFETADDETFSWLRDNCKNALPDISKRKAENTAIAFRGQEPIGAVSVDTDVFSDEGAALIDVYWLTEDWRDKNFSPQLLGKAVSICRGRGFKELRAEFEDEAAGGLMHFGFEKYGEKDGKNLLKMGI